MRSAGNRAGVPPGGLGTVWLGRGGPSPCGPWKGPRRAGGRAGLASGREGLLLPVGAGASAPGSGRPAGCRDNGPGLRGSAPGVAACCRRGGAGMSRRSARSPPRLLREGASPSPSSPARPGAPAAAEEPRLPNRQGHRETPSSSTTPAPRHAAPKVTELHLPFTNVPSLLWCARELGFREEDSKNTNRHVQTDPPYWP